MLGNMATSWNGMCAAAWGKVGGQTGQEAGNELQMPHLHSTGLEYMLHGDAKVQ